MERRRAVAVEHASRYGSITSRVRAAERKTTSSRWAFRSGGNGFSLGTIRVDRISFWAPSSPASDRDMARMARRSRREKLAVPVSVFPPSSAEPVRGASRRLSSRGRRVMAAASGVRATRSSRDRSRISLYPSAWATAAICHRIDSRYRCIRRAAWSTSRRRVFSGSWVAIPTGHLPELQSMHPVHPAATSMAVPMPTADAPRAMALAASRPFWIPPMRTMGS